MRTGLYEFVSTAFFLGAAVVGLAPMAMAADMGIPVSRSAIGSCTEIVFTCENGHTYPLCPIAVSVVGEVVTASLYTDRGSTHVRMIPMGLATATPGAEFGWTASAKTRS